MFVISREVGKTIVVTSTADSHQVTVLKLLSRQRAVAVRITRASDLMCLKPKIVMSDVELVLNVPLELVGDVAIRLVDLCGDRAFIGVTVPKDKTVIRLEVWRAMGQPSNPPQSPNPDDDMPGSSVPRPSSPKPPSLKVLLEEPPAE
jgi:sRNA-binding carbon storage regulator CsrA